MASSAETVNQPNPTESTLFWCHACDMSVSIFSSSPFPLCPLCHGDFLEHLDDSPPLNPHHPSSLSTFLNNPSLPDSPSDSDSEPDLPYLSFHTYLDRLIHHLSTHPQSSGPRSCTPASKSSVQSIPTVKITCSSEPLICPVCKDEFLVDAEAKRLPCNHIYHGDCILPWLAQHNSCPVCRFCLPTDDDRAPAGVGNSEEGELERALRHITRRHRLVFPTRSSPTQLAQAETSSAAGPANSGETVSSRPVEGASGCPRPGASTARGTDEEGDAVMSEVRVDLFD